MNVDANDIQFDHLRRSWDTVEEWDRKADPMCPCKDIVAPMLKDWRDYKADWLAGAPDAAGLDEQTLSFRNAIATIKRYSRPGPLGDLAREHFQRMVDAHKAELEAEGESCSIGDPRCRPLDDDGDARMGALVNTWRYVVETPAGRKTVATGITDTNSFDASMRQQFGNGQRVYIFRETEQGVQGDAPQYVPIFNTLSQDRLMDPAVGAAPLDAVQAQTSAQADPLAGLLGILADPAKAIGAAAQGPASDAGKAAGQAAAASATEAARQAAPGVVAAASEAAKAQIPTLVKQASDVAATTLQPLAEDLGRKAGKAAGEEAGRAAVKSAQEQARAEAWSTGEKVVGVVVVGGAAVGIGYGLYRLLGGGSRKRSATA